MNTRTPRMYVLVRKDLSETYRCVQGTHAVAQYALEQSDLFRVWGNQTIVFLGVSNLLALRAWNEKLIAAGKHFSVFREPDLDGQETAIACFDLGDIFKDLHLV